MRTTGANQNAAYTYWVDFRDKPWLTTLQLTVQNNDKFRIISRIKRPFLQPFGGKWSHDIADKKHSFVFTYWFMEVWLTFLSLFLPVFLSLSSIYTIFSDVQVELKSWKSLQKINLDLYTNQNFDGYAVGWKKYHFIGITTEIHTFVIEGNRAWLQTTLQRPTQTFIAIHMPTEA